MSEAWVTDQDLRAAYTRFADEIPGFAIPVAYGVARKDGPHLTFGHINAPGAVRPLPAVVLAGTCGYVADTDVYRLDRDLFASAIARLTPAEAAIHMPHPNLWSWRELLAGSNVRSTFLAFFIARLDDPPLDSDDEQFRNRLVSGSA
ncbi:hypothetical protein [Actinopolymorpha rutila]|uniref:Uncharacterized protein n=1 Tax=Actinopolymorpha rutila TaxID=446787 RepID=A0A852Z5G0_9ACTN|nr:hypothetical protein [Actinopolymorpha rutila]NYH87613.1 hypothetical protein [Actinopolymorpha rutila]